MIGWQHYHDRLAGDLADDEVGLDQRPSYEGDVQTALPQPRDWIDGVLAVQHEAKVGQMLGDERPQRGQDAHVRRWKRADRQLARAPIRGLLREPPGMLDSRENVFRLLQKNASRVGERDVLPAAIEQFDAHYFFELTYLLTQRRLSGANSYRCTREAKLFGDRDEVA